MLKRNLVLLIVMAMFITCLSHGVDFAYATPDDKPNEDGSTSIPVISTEAQYDQSVSHTWTHPLTMEVSIPASSVFSAQDALHITFPSNVDMSSVHISPETEVPEFEVATNDNIFSLTSMTEQTFANELRFLIEFHLQNVADTGKILTTFVSNGDDSVATPVATSLAVISTDSPEPVGMTPYSTPPVIRLLSPFPFDNQYRRDQYTTTGFNNLINSPTPWHSLFHFIENPDPWHVYLAIIVTEGKLYTDPVLTLYSTHPVIASSVLVTAQTIAAEMETVAATEYNVMSSTLISGEYQTKIVFPNGFSDNINDYFFHFAIGDDTFTISDKSSASASYQDETHNVLRGETSTGEFLNASSTLTIKKEVVGSYADTSFAFPFRIVVSYNEPPPYLSAIPFRKTAADGTVTFSTMLLSTNGSFEFELAHNETIAFEISTFDPTLANRPIYYRIYEYDSIYETTVRKHGATEFVPMPSFEDGGILEQLTGDATVLFRNTRTQPPVPTAVTLADMPYILLCTLVILLGSAYTYHIYQKKK